VKPVTEAVFSDVRGKTRPVELESIDDFMEIFYERGWTDGLPVVPPTERSVRRFLDANGLKHDAVVADFPERNRRVTAEQVAINCVMAGCKPEYMPVVIAAVEGMARPSWSFNHVAGRCSVWPLLIVSGPVVDKLGFNTGVWALGGGDRPSMTIGRALSLIMWNCIEVKPESILRGAVGNAGRFAACLAEKQDGPWEPTHIQEGFDRDVSTVTVTSVYAECGRGMFETLDPHIMAQQMTYVGFDQFYKGAYVVQMGPECADFFASQGWSKQDLRQYLFDNTRRSVADLKRTGRWGRNTPEVHLEAEDLRILPGDEEKWVYLFRDDTPEEYRKYLFSSRDSGADIFIVPSGGDSGYLYDIRTGHGRAVKSSTVPIKMID
jgi:hypothetical protein